jgi:hypothetical protein
MAYYYEGGFRMKFIDKLKKIRDKYKKNDLLDTILYSCKRSAENGRKTENWLQELDDDTLLSINQKGIKITKVTNCGQFFYYELSGW